MSSSFHQFWERFHELIIVLIVWLGLLATYYLLTFIAYQSFSFIEEPADISGETLFALTAIFSSMTDWALLLSLLVSPFAIYASATNTRLSLPIRLLSMAENLNRFLYAFSSSMDRLCAMSGGPVKCNRWFLRIVNSFSHLVDFYPLIDISQYCQLLISFSRFFALSLNGLYFNYTKKLPLIQLVIPYLFGAGFEHFRQWCWEEYLREQISAVPLLLMCALDYMTNRRLKELRKEGKASRTEVLLMMQMLANSFMNFINTIVFTALIIFFQMFFGPYLSWAALQIVTFLRVFMFSLIASTASFLLLKQRKDQRAGSMKSSVQAFTTNVS